MSRVQNKVVLISGAATGIGAPAECTAANVRVKSLHPTDVNTSMAEYGAQTAGVSVDDLGPALFPLGRIAETGDVVNFILFSASDEASYLTSSEYTIDGGGSTLLSVG